MRFAQPHILWFLLLLPALVFVAWRANRKRAELMARFIGSRLLPGLTHGLSPARRRLRFALFLAALIAAILALARPQWGFTWEEARLRGLDIVVAIDTSKSMLAEDIAPNRLARAKLAALDLLRAARTDRLGLVAFAGTAFLQCPLTIDEEVFRQSLEALDVNVIPQGGTALAEAIQTALTAFKEGDNHRILVLFSDGEDHDSGAVDAARKAAESGLRIYTIGVGTPEGELLRIKTPAGTTDYIRDEQGNVVKSRLNEDLLRQVAGATEGGFYLPLRGARTIETLYSEALSKLPKADRQAKLVKRYHERFHWPLGIAIALLIAEMLLPEAVRPRKRSTATSFTTTAPVRRVLALAFVLALAPFAARAASPSTALREYRSGNYREAQQEYEQLRKRNTEDPRLNFNSGAAAYRDGKFDDATKRFGEALNSPDLQLQESAYYNRGNSYYYLGEQDPTKRSEAWKKSLQDFQSALKLNPKDQDAEFNRQLVKKRLEELQQQPQSQNSDKKDPNQDQQQQEQQQGDQQQQQDKPDQNQQQQQQQQQQSADQQQQQQQAQAQPQQEPQKQAQPQPKEQAQAAQQQQAAQAKAGDDKEKEKGAQEAVAPGEMTPEEARRLLDSQKADEKMLPPNSRNQPSNPYRPFKDW